MSSPIGHSLAGYTIYDLESRGNEKDKFVQIIIFIFIANAPDLDILPGLLIGKPNLFHHGISHSISVGVLFSLIIALFFYLSKTRYFLKMFLFSFIVYSSHLILDYLSYDGRPPIGIPIFWPFNSEYYISPFPLLPYVSHSSLDHATISQFVAGVFSFHNLKVVMLEILVISPILVVKKIVNFIRNKKSTRLNRGSHS